MQQNDTSTSSPSWWRRKFGRSILKALIGTDIDISNRQSAASIIAIMVIGTLCWIAIFYSDVRSDIIKTLSGVIFVIIGFYFGKERQRSDDSDD